MLQLTINNSPAPFFNEKLTIMELTMLQLTSNNSPAPFFNEKLTIDNEQLAIGYPSICFTWFNASRVHLSIGKLSIVN